ncbi:MAG: hypothetical protein DMF70_07535 [Acidobacteria bacterium]|nr:MAG: hypothetical protein DMF70_07535 [Acidobacteriota bacterium]
MCLHFPQLSFIKQESNKMGKQEDANLILKLYDLRREPVMREARNWFFSFNPTTTAEYMEAMMGEHTGHLRMVITYWDMAASLVNNGAIDEQMFNDANGEHLFIFAKIEPIPEGLRQEWGQPDMLKNFETLIRRIPENKERLAAIRDRIKMITAMMTERAEKAKAVGAAGGLSLGKAQAPSTIDPPRLA